MLIRVGLQFDVPFVTSEEVAFLDQQIAEAGEEAFTNQITKDVYEIFKEELLEAENVFINVSVVK